jgi:flagellar motor protein MotB
MAKGGGGSWKVAYADFVTAMMAFFLVMWIGAQDQKIRQSVANYFVDPSGVAKKPVQNGAVLDAMTYGSMPKQDAVAMGQGTRTFTNSNEPSPGTRALSNWIHADEKRLSYWRDKAQECRKMARDLKVSDSGKNPDEFAAQELAKLLRAETSEGIPPQTAEIYKDLLFVSINDVNWMQLAEHLLLGSEE